MLVHHRVTLGCYLFIHQGGERHCDSKVSCPRTQHMSLLARDQTQNTQSGGKSANQQASTPPHSNPEGVEIFPVSYATDTRISETETGIDQ